MTSNAERYQNVVELVSDDDETKNSLVSFGIAEDELNQILDSSELYITNDERDFLRDYLGDLENLRPWARKIKSEEDSKTKQKTIKKINNLIQELEIEINTALDEDRTLEQIAATLRDRRLTEEAERIKAGLEQPEARLERLAEKKNQTREFLDKFEKIREKVGEGKSLDHALEKRMNAVNLILEHAHERDKKKIKLGIPAWERENFDTDAIYVEPEQSNDLDLMLEVAIDLVKLADNQGVIDPDMNKSVKALYTHIDYARKEKNRRSTKSGSYDVLNHHTHSRVKVWINAGVTLSREGKNLPGDADRLILVDNKLFDEPEALLATLVHELMHAYFEHKENPSHKEIHVMAEAVLRTCLELDIDEEEFMLENIIDSKPVSREEVNKAYLYALASEGLFPG